MVWEEIVNQVVGWGAWAIIIILVLIFVFILMGIAIWIIYSRLKYNKKINIFEIVGNDYEPTRKDKACEIRVGTAGDSVFYLKKNKKYLPMPSIQTGRRTYWYAIRPDGEWENVGLENIDFKMKRVKIRFLDKEMRHSRTALQEILKERYKSTTFLQKWGGLIAYIGLICVVGIMMWLLFDKFLDFSNGINQGIQLSKELTEKQEQILSAMDKLGGSSGIKPAGLISSLILKT